jgi:hypothetical protein
MNRIVRTPDDVDLFARYLNFFKDRFKDMPKNEVEACVATMLWFLGTPPENLPDISDKYTLLMQYHTDLNKMRTTE